jgi:4-amino-4-deoxy-L-arabinose transferase-like glycosyltransferase
VIFLILVAGVIAAYLLSRYSFPERYPAVFLLAASYLSALFFWREPEVIIDASRYFTQAKHLELYGVKFFVREWGGGINSWTDLPLVPFLYGLIFRFAGESRVFIQALTTGLFSLTVLLTYLVGKSLWDKYTGFYAGLLLMGIPYLFTQVPLMLVDVPAMFFFTLSVFTFIMALERGGVWSVVSPPVIFLAMLSKYSTWLMLSVLLVILTVYLIREAECRRKVFYRALIIWGITGILLSAFVWYEIDVISEQIILLQEYQKPGLKRWGESFISTFFFQVHPLVSIYAVYSIYEAIRNKDISYIIICWLVLLVFLLQIRRARYILIVFPMLALMASYGMQSIRIMQARKFLVYSIVVSSLVVSSLVFFPFLSKGKPQGWRQVSGLA